MVSFDLMKCLSATFYTREQKFIFTIFQGPDHLHFAVSPLELIKEGPYFKLIYGSSLQLTDHHPIFPWGVHFRNAPLTLWLAVFSRRPVKHLVTLDVRGLLLHLVDNYR